MYLKELHIRNFKSIKEADITFPPMTLVVGANAAGKSNLISVFRFLSDVMTQGLETAVSLQGGVEWMANVNLPKGTPIEIGFTLDASDVLPVDRFYFPVDVEKGIRVGRLRFNTIWYSFSICPDVEAYGYQIKTDILELRGQCIPNADTPRHEDVFSQVGNISFKIFQNGLRGIACSCSFTDAVEADAELQGRIRIGMLEETMGIFGLGRMVRSLSDENLFESEPDFMISDLLFHYLARYFEHRFDSRNFIRVYDFDARKLKVPAPVASVPFLKEDGSNVATVLKGILRDKGSSKDLHLILSDFLPFAQNVQVKNDNGKYLSYSIQEKYNDKTFQQDFLSDGTVCVLATLIALYFQEQHILILEEPERNLHSRLLAKLLPSAEDVSTEKQVILTTHNPEFLKYANIENVLLVKRDSDGFTTFSYPKNSENVRIFLENDIGLDDLFLQNLLGV